MKGERVLLILAFVGFAAATPAKSQADQAVTSGEGEKQVMPPPDTSTNARSYQISQRDVLADADGGSGVQENLKTKKFDVMNLKLNWTAALAKCKERHTDLATVRNQEENDLMTQLIMKTLPSCNCDIWLGGTVLNSVKGYYWMTDGETVKTYENWIPGEPNNGFGIERCLAFGYYGATGWNDVNCNEELPFVCEYY